MLSSADLARVRDRDPAVLDAFFDEYFGRVHGLILRTTVDRAMAEDLTQETFLRIHRALGTLDPGRDPWPWVAAIAVNVCRDHRGSAPWRRRTRFRSLESEPALAADLREAGSDSEELARSRQEAARVQAAVQKLAEPQRLVVLLHAWHGFGHDQIAQMTGRSHAAVRQQYRRAIRLLGELLSGAET